MVTIVPAILAKDKNFFMQCIKKIEGNFTQIQIDVCTQDFVGINTLPLSEMELPNKIEVGWHLMSNSFAEFEQMKKFNTVNVIVHFESLLRKEALADKVAKGVRWGLAVNPETNINQIRKLLNQYDFIQLMGVIPGAQGKDFQPAIVEKISLLKDWGIVSPIWINGGINLQSVKYLKGCDIETLVVGSYLLKTGDIVNNKKILERSLYE